VSVSDRLSQNLPQLPTVELIKGKGTVQQMNGMLIEAQGFAAPVGHLCEIYPRHHARTLIKAEVVGCRAGHPLLATLNEMRGIQPGSMIIHRGEPTHIRISTAVLGRVVDADGMPIKDREAFTTASNAICPLYTPASKPSEPRRIRAPLDLGIRAINGLLTCGQGQRLAIVADAATPWRSLLGAITRHAQAGITVMAILAATRPQLRAFLDRDLDASTLQQTVVVATYAEQMPLMHIRGAYAALAISEYYRDQAAIVNLTFKGLRLPIETALVKVAVPLNPRRSP
jgi:flagellum-specific ATP synthase